MKKIGLLIETNDGELKPANLGMITAARDAEHELHAIMLEPVTPEIREQLARYGVARIVKVNLPDPTWHPEHWSHAVSSVLPIFQIRTLLGLTTARGRDLLPRIAADLDAPLVMDCIHIDIGRQTAKTSQYSGKTIASLQVFGNSQIFGLRPNVTDPAPEPTETQVVEFDVPMKEYPGLEIVEHLASAQGSQNLSEADVIIAGGRGLKSRENFTLLNDCAKYIQGAAVGASRVAVDEGWAPYPMQVGQTGTKVNPKVYLACGISGSVQHYAGMKTAALIIAVNNDAEAAIMGNCDYYACADLFEVLPELSRQLSLRSSA